MFYDTLKQCLFTMVMLLFSSRFLSQLPGSMNRSTSYNEQLAFPFHFGRFFVAITVISANFIVDFPHSLHFEFAS